MNFAAAFDATAEAGPDRIAVCTDHRVLTRSELRESIVMATHTLIDRWSVRRGDRVAYLGLNRYEELVLLFALARVGAVFMPLNTRLAASELAGIVEHARPRALVTDAGHRDVGMAIVEGVVSRTAGVTAWRTIDALLAGGDRRDAPIEDVDPQTPLLLAYTSGTSGAPKGATHTHGGVLANAIAAIAAHDMTEDDRVLTVLPLFHVGGLCIQTVPALLAGASVVLQPRFDAKAWLDAVAAMRPTLTLMVPATLRAVIGHGDWGGADLSCLRVLMTGSSTIPRQLIDAVHARGVPVGQIYGSTETGPVTVALKAADARRKPGFAGWPCFPGSLRLIDAGGADVDDGSVGEIVVRAPNVMQGYWQEPATSGFRDGWFATGDLGRLDDEGCLEVVGRHRDLIITGGENVYPAELEDVLLSIAGVSEAAVVGLADERWGEVPAAFVVRGGTAATALDEADVAAAFEGRLARFKHPKRVVFVDALPRNAMGKVQAQLLRERLAKVAAG